MRRRTRKFFGAVFILVFVIVYALVTMALAQGRLQDADKIWQNLYYVVAGLGWILPLMPVIKWMEKPDPEDA
jgi:quinol-cytochrome oxidoreductase complex cytochrome b subunit